MRITLLLIAAAVLLSLVLDADAAIPTSRYDEIHSLLQSGPISVPARVRTGTEYLCYSRGNPNKAIHLAVDADADRVRRMASDSERMNYLVQGMKINLGVTALPIFNGALLGGRSYPANLLDSLRINLPQPSIFFGMSMHLASGRSLAAILKITQEQDVETACSNTESLEYVCIENLDEG